MKLFFKGKIVEIGGKKKLEITTHGLYERIIDSTKVGNVVVSIEPEKSQRSISQNSYYWLYLTVIANETGHTQDDLHQYFKRTLLPPRFIKVFGKEVKIPASTTELSKGEMVDYIMRIQAEVEIPPPDPEAAGFISNYKRII